MRPSNQIRPYSAAATPRLACLLLLAVLLGNAACNVSFWRPSTTDPKTLSPTETLEAQNQQPGEAIHQPTPSQAVVHAAEELPLPYVIQSGDLIEVSVWKNTELSRTVLVRPDGRISLPLLNEIPAAGRTALELRALIAEKLAEYVSTGEVSVIVHEVKSVAVSVIGEVRQPGRYQLQNRTTVLDALAMAGGLTEFASSSGIAVLRSDGAQTKRLRFDYPKATSPDGADENFVVHAGDIIVVP